MRSQRGAIHPLVVLIVLVALALWQWDNITKAFHSKFTPGGPNSVDLLGYTCRTEAGGRVSTFGRVRNTSEKPLDLSIRTAIYDSSDKKSDYRDAPVRPSPLAPGQDGLFQGDAPPLPDGGSCKFDGVLDSGGSPIRVNRR